MCDPEQPEDSQAESYDYDPCEFDPALTSAPDTLEEEEEGINWTPYDDELLDP